MHKNSIVCGATDAHTLAGISAEAKSSAYIGAVTRSRQSQGSGRRWVGVLVLVTAAAVLVLAGCADGGGTAAPTVSGVKFTATTTTATVTATVNKAGKLFWVAYSDNTVPADAAALIADAGKAKTTPIVANSGPAGHTVSDAGTVSVEITGLTENTSYDLYAVAQDTAGNSSVLSAKVAVRTTDATAPAVVTSITATGFGATGVRLIWTNPDPTTDDLKQIALQWATIGNPDSVVGSQTVSNLTEGGQSIHIVSDLIVGNIYRFSLIAVDTSNNRSAAATVDGAPLIDHDNDKLIDIHNLDMLNNARYNLAGTFYTDTAGATSGLQCGTTGTTACTGYELTRNLDFATAGDYASGTVNSAWRPNASTPATSTNGGWLPISTIFTGIFDGNGRTISNLYVRNSASGAYGLFGQLSGTVRNLGVVDGTVYGNGNVGIVVGIAKSGSTIIASYASGTADSRGSSDVGGLVGQNNGTIIASYASGTVNNTEGNTGGLVGSNTSNSTIIASYASSDADGGAENLDVVGGLVGSNSGAIIASYASGDADGGAGTMDSVGGLVGNNNSRGTITASYAIGIADGGAGLNDDAGSLAGCACGGTITVSYGFGTIINGETAVGVAGSTDRPTGAGAVGSGIAGARKLNALGTTMPPNTAVPAAWNAAASKTLAAWDFGSASQAPALKYADYDGTGTVYNCNQFPAGVCGTLIPGQTALR